MRTVLYAGGGTQRLQMEACWGLRSVFGGWDAGSGWGYEAGQVGGGRNKKGCNTTEDPWVLRLSLLTGVGGVSPALFCT